MLGEVEAFVSALSRASRAADNTTLNYRRDLLDLRRFLLERAVALDSTGEEIAPGRIDSDHIRSYLGDLMKRDRRPATVQRRLFAIKAFFRWREAALDRRVPRA